MVLTLEKRPPFSKRPYKFEMMWTTHPQCKEVIKEAWNGEVQGSPPFKLTRKVKFVREKLKRWNKEVFGDLVVRKKRLENELARVQQNIQDADLRDEELALKKELENVLEQEHILWMQKSRANWIIKGERNTKYFHTVTKKRIARNRIFSIKGNCGQVIEDPTDIERTFLHILKETFCNQQEESETGIRALLQSINLPTLSPEHLEKLNAPFSEEEVKITIFSKGPLKAPGYDGKPALFFQKFWDIVG
ncbi:hypothetical protein COLO4_26732 [Corchorus olitorius]|uniref:Reverse transcriptase n=1 Tax=Corchorus olitorius TaxID=93759 RepID=A0A1R3HUR0_9ROSI|nr:hypothetical protein COLO4_26732 [Corchorus olitorius]